MDDKVLEGKKKRKGLEKFGDLSRPFILLQLCLASHRLICLTACCASPLVAYLLCLAYSSASTLAPLTTNNSSNTIVASIILEFIGFLPPPPNEVLKGLNCLCPKLATSAMLMSLCVAKNLPRNNSYMCSKEYTRVLVKVCPFTVVVMRAPHMMAIDLTKTVARHRSSLRPELKLGVTPCTEYGVYCGSGSKRDVSSVVFVILLFFQQG
ncbi:hypothetical protein ACLOJK_007443 [Asimina triloba]